MFGSRLDSIRAFITIDVACTVRALHLFHLSATLKLRVACCVSGAKNKEDNESHKERNKREFSFAQHTQATDSETAFVVCFIAISDLSTFASKQHWLAHLLLRKPEKLSLSF